MFARLSDWLDRTAFPKIANAEVEADKVAMVRIATGMVLVWRGAFMLRDSVYRIRIFRNHASDFSLGTQPERYRPELVLEFQMRAGHQLP